MVDLRVDDAHHAQLAVHALRAVVPDGLGVVDEDGEDGGEDAVGGHKAGEDALYGGHDVLDGCAGVGEGGLDDGVVLWRVGQRWNTRGGEWVGGWEMVKGLTIG